MGANLPFSERHNICAFLAPRNEKFKEFLPLCSYLRKSTIGYALQEYTTIHEKMIRHFWKTAAFSEQDGVQAIKAKVCGFDVEITEEVIREVLRLGEPGGLTSLPFEELKRFFDRIGYQGDYAGKMVKKTLLYRTWRFLLHVLIHCIGIRKGGFDEASAPVQAAYVALVQERNFNWANLIMIGMRYNIVDAAQKNRHLMYPRFLQLILNQLLKDKHFDRGEDVLVQRHMREADFSYSMSIFVKSAYESIQVPLFGPIIGQPYIEEEEHGGGGPVGQPGTSASLDIQVSAMRIIPIQTSPPIQTPQDTPSDSHDHIHGCLNGFEHVSDLNQEGEKHPEKEKQSEISSAAGLTDSEIVEKSLRSRVEKKTKSSTPSRRSKRLMDEDNDDVHDPEQSLMRKRQKTDKGKEAVVEPVSKIASKSSAKKGSSIHKTSSSEIQAQEYVQEDQSHVDELVKKIHILENNLKLKTREELANEHAILQSLLDLPPPTEFISKSQPTSSPPKHTKKNPSEGASKPVSKGASKSGLKKGLSKHKSPSSKIQAQESVNEEQSQVAELMKKIHILEKDKRLKDEMMIRMQEQNNRHEREMLLLRSQVKELIGTVNKLELKLASSFRAVLDAHHG